MPASELICGSAPVLSCEAAGQLEARLFGGDEAREWAAMQCAGEAVARGVLEDFQELGRFPARARVLVLAGKGHNGGDALIAATRIAREHPDAQFDVGLVFGARSLRPLAARAWREFCAAVPAGIRRVDLDEPIAGYDLCLDGIFGFQFRPPADDRVQALLRRVNAAPIRLRAAVDLPSAGLFQADFTYATGVVKQPLLEGPGRGRIRYLDLGFFSGEAPDPSAHERVLSSDLLRPLAALRSPASDKRSHGHLFIVGGSRSYSGAVLMSALAAVRSGTGLVTVFVPESLVPAYAARLPEAMWVGWPETPAGALALEGHHLLRERLDRATALVVGPGLTHEPETLALARDIVRRAPVPVLVDADALRPEVLEGADAALVLTPHAGEYHRIAGEAGLADFARTSRSTVVLKGPLTRIASGWLRESETTADGTVYVSPFGGPVLARGGSGDLLAGIVGGLLARAPADCALAAARGVVWHGMAADFLAGQRGQTAVETTQLLDFLGPVLRSL